MHNIGFQLYRVVYKGLACFEEGPVPHSDDVYIEAISKVNRLLKFDRN